MNTDDRTSGRRIGRFFSPALVSLALVLGACSSGSSDTAQSDTAASNTAAPDEPATLALDDGAAVDSAAGESAAGESAAGESATSADAGAGPTADAADMGDTGTEGVFDIAEFASLADLESVELTPELFEQLKTNEASRAAIIVEMQNQGLDIEQSECFLDTVSPGLFIAFGTGQQPDDAQFGELLGLLDTCQIAFGGES